MGSMLAVFVEAGSMRVLDPSYEGGKALPTMERSGIMKPLSTPGVSVTESEHGSHDPNDGGNIGSFSVDDGEVQVSWKGRSACGPHGSDDSPTTTICRRFARNDDASTEVPGIVGNSCSDGAKIPSDYLDVSAAIVGEVTGSDTVKVSFGKDSSTVVSRCGIQELTFQWSQEVAGHG